MEARTGYAKVEMTVSDMHLNGGGTCQGGAIFTLADLAFAVCVNSHGLLTVSLSSNISFPHAPRLGDVLTAEAVEVFDHPKVPCCRVDIRDQNGNLVATFSGQAYRKNVPLPL